MKSFRYIIGTCARRSLWLLLFLMLMIMATTVHAQNDTQYASITIGGNVYGGGNEGDTGGSTSVTVRAGEIGSVFGGARMANVGGSAFVNIDGEHASDDILITSVYGGNDIAGTIGTSTKLPVDDNDHPLLSHTNENNITNSWNAFVRTSRSSKIVNNETVEDKVIIIGTLYGGGNGDYGDSDNDGKYVAGTTYAGLLKPVLGKTYLEIMGGCIAHMYGGGNNATVIGNTTIYINNSSDELNKTVAAWAAAHDNLTQQEVITYLINKVKLPTFQSNLTSFSYNFSRVFGGNNQAPMAIRPTWNLQKGVIRDLYSGGNKGAMTYQNGILLHVNPSNSNDLKIENVFGGCRMADVNPDKAAIEEETIDGTYFPAGYAARVLIEGGDINNVYGGNDISGNIYGGNAVGIHSSIKGDVYGGGNGSYAYTDNKDLATSDLYGDFYYNVKDILGLSDNGFTGAQSVEALNIFRPNAEAVSVRLVGTKEKPTIIGGAVFCGGNSATLRNDDPDIDAAAELKIGSYVIADKVFLGNNGEKMKDTGILERYAKSVDASGNIVTSGGYDFSQMDLASESKTNGQTQFDIYMDGVTMDIMPRVVFDDVGAYVPYSTYFGSFYCGGNVGSMRRNGAINISFTDKVVIFDKVVGGSNEANVYQSAYNAQYLGGLLGNPDDDGNKLILNFNGLKIEPRRWNSTYAVLDENEEFVVGNKYYTSALGDGEFTATSSTTKKEGTAYYKLIDRGSDLVWNTVSASSGNNVEPVTSGSGNSNAYDLDRRLKGGNIYGGCYLRGHVNGNVVINLNASIHERDKLFDVVSNEGDILYENVEKAEENASYYNISQRNTGVILSQQGMDVLGAALNVFGGGYGGDSEIWGSTTINLNAGYTFQIFGGGEMGTIGKAEKYNETTKELEYDYNSNYSTYINLNGAEDLPGVARGTQGDDANMAECEFIYGGAFEGLICGDTHINLNNGRIFNTFAGSCNADILGHTETYVGQNGFPWVRDHLYGGNDLGGSILGEADFLGRIRDEVKGMVADAYKNQISKAASYMEYTQGRVGRIFGGSFGDYDYINDFPTITKKPYLHNSFVNIRPNTDENNEIEKVFGAGEGYPGNRDGDKAQDHSYVLIDIPDGVENFVNTEVFGAGAYNGLGMKEFLAPQTKPAENASEEELEAYNAYETALDEVSAIVDLMRGWVGAAYGGSYEQGITRRTVVNVPEGSTIKIGSIFGGAYGAETYEPCDVYEANVNYRTHSEQAYLIYNPRREDEKTKQMIGNVLQKGAIYGGNNQERRTLYGKINIYAPVRQKHHAYGMTTATVYGAGCGSHTWNEYTEVNLNPGASVWEVYGGGEAGGVMNAESAQAYIKSNPYHVEPEDYWKSAWTLGSGYDGETFANGCANNSYADNTYTNLNNPLVRVAEIDDRADIASTDTKHYKRYNTNVIIHKGAYVGNYAYGGGYGSEDDQFYGSGDVYGTTYIALLGGVVKKDLYAAGTMGAVYNLFGAEFTASTNAYIAGGMLRNVYGGGWEGNVGYSKMENGVVTTETSGETHVVIGIRKDRSEVLPADYGFYNGVPAIQRNAYSGGEGGSVFGTAHLTLNNGYIGYYYSQTAGADTPDDLTDDQYDYIEKIHDETWTDHVGLDRLSDCGNLFGGGYDDNSSVDFTDVTVWGGVVRNSVFGGGEIATVGRGKVKESDVDNKVRELESISKFGGTKITIYNGHVKRNVFGGGKGYNILGYGGIHGFYTDGYVFGQTEVYIHGGEIGTDAGVADGYGNVFGGGDVGFVYGKGYFASIEAAEPTESPNHIYYKDGNGNLTEDCKVVIAPMLQLKPNKSVTFGKDEDDNDIVYNAYDYVPTEYLNTLSGDKTVDEWRNLFTGDKITNAQGEAVTDPDDPVERGVQIHNAVFAGGNVSSNSESYNNAITVFGNSTATLYDVFHRDFITIGTEHTGGLYGGGNLSVVGGYRELNITNYGTDYYGMDEQISLAKYQTLTNRERAYFQLEYVCKDGTQTKVVNGETKYGVYIDDEFYANGSRVKEDDYEKLKTKQGFNENNWEQFGFCSIYAGRLLNTIQRADFCGVFGSRLVLQGAKDRVADVGDATEYTINRVGELSLNQQRFTPDDDSEIHGNYFGIYSIVNYLGNLTSDVRFTDTRRYILNGQTQNDPDGKSYYNYKVDNLTKRDRNNGTSFNQVALASGVFLEITSENSTPSNKIYGDITGVVELDLINVKKDIEGGGYVYARNEHGERSTVTNTNSLLSSYNKQTGNEALTKKIYTYSPTTLYSYQTSGNFIHKSKRIVDDCYPNNGVWTDNKGNYVTSPAHYWFIKGEVYIYDQVVSAYAGSATAYSKEVKIPLTITAGSNGKLKLLNIQPSLYAYYADNTRDETKKITADGIPVDNESAIYKLNDVITWWDWHQLSENEQKYFVKETYVNVDPCIIDGTPYEAGAYVLENDKSIHTITAWDTFQTAGHTVLNAAGDEVTDLSKLFHSSNNISHNTGYVLTLDMNSPKDWDDWYTPVNNNSVLPKIGKDEYKALSDADKAKYREGPTYTLKDGEGSGLYGQRQYAVGEIISDETFKDYSTTVSVMNPKPTGQATVEPAFVAVDEFGTMQAGTAISTTDYNALSESEQDHFAQAMVCVNTIQLGEEDYVLLGELVSGKDEDLAALAAKYKKYNNDKINADPVDDDGALEYIKEHLSKAYYVTGEGLYGGQYFQSGTNYAALKSWNELTESREKFDFNYDALDVLVDPQYHGEGTISTYYKSPYSDEKSVEYTAAYTGGANGTSKLTYTDGNGDSHELSQGDIILRDDYENYIRNEQLHYTRIQVEKGSDTQTVYIVTENIINNGTPYAKGQDISEKDYNALTGENKARVATVVFQKNSTETQILYYCLDDYTPSQDLTTVSGTAGAAGSVISALSFTGDVPNDQKDFTIQGAEPTETTTLYVSRESNAKDVTSEKVISVVYQYTYYEADDEGEGVSLVNELHVVNIHLKLESGAPEIGPLTAPPAVLPGNTLGLKAPSVNPGLYEVLTSGWEIFSDETDAMLHRNGAPFTNNGTPLYWYQNQKTWLAFYSKTYLGKTYSNYVPLTVANYHDLDAVMKDKEHHLYVDKSNVERPCKIYLDNRECESNPNKNELDLLKDFFDLSLQTPTAEETTYTIDETVHNRMNPYVHGARNLEFYLNSNIDHSTKPNPNYDPENPESTERIPATWNSIGNNNTTGDTGQCFEGTLHGDGYTISGLDNSLFAHLCGEVYNLGVTGTFTGAGIAEEGDGYVENCWVKTSGTPADGVNAVFNNPIRTEGDRRGLIQVENCYYPESNNYSVPSSSTHGKATQMPDKAFYNGEVAYNLNSFYLHKRYYQGTNLGEGSNNISYKYLQPNADGTLPDNMSTGYYPDTYALYQPEVKVAEGETKPYMGYVESRFYDGDYRYADGTIPESSDIRMRTETVGEGDNAVTTTYYVPIWPDDYIFFGQTLNYGYVDDYSHQDLPSHINKSNDRLQTDAGGNRVYRAPAYFGNNTMSVAHFNPNAVFAQSNNKVKETYVDTVAYRGMTAIDFTGYNDASYLEGLQGGKFFPPLLDDDGLIGFNNVDLTQNLLAYAPLESSNQATHDVLDNYFGDLACQELGDDSDTDADEAKYHRIAPVTIYEERSVKGHVVFPDGNTYIADRDHFLVDKQDFNAPIGYTFDTDNRMWYQRRPDNFVGKKKEDESGFIQNGAGWEGISLPFTAEIVTTNVKGEITHFYNYGDNWKGHEYWLREFNGGSMKEGSSDIFVATFNKPDAGSTSKVYTNTFLWDYYYSNNSRYDKNSDQYPDASYRYYSEARTHDYYPRLANATPYIIGFPGERYYEFDLSGNFVARTAKATIPELLSAQVITFASSAEGITIGVSDTELKDHRKTVENCDYTFIPNYGSKTLGSTAYILNTEDADEDKQGSSYDVTTATEPATTLAVVPFRPYFMEKSHVPDASRTTRGIGQSVRSIGQLVRTIVFSNETSQLKGVDDRDLGSEETGSLSIYPGRKKIVVESALKVAADVRIVNTAGITVTTFTIEPGETVETHVNNSGVYIVQTTDGYYNKKLVVR